MKYLSIVDLVQNNNRPIDYQLEQGNRQPIDLPDGTIVKLALEQINGTKLVVVECEVLQFTDVDSKVRNKGKVRIPFNGSDLDTVGSYKGQFQVERPSGERFSVPNKRWEPFFVNADLVPG